MNLEIFKNENFEVRVAVDENNEPLFCLTDICRALEIQNANGVKNAIDTEFDKGGRFNLTPLQTAGGLQNFIMITESELYFVLMRSDKPNAKPFRMFVNKEVLPSIRKTGSYTQNFIPQDLPTALRAYANEVEQKELALKQRDQALATKAWIGSKRETTAMATASAAKRENERLKVELDKSKEWASIKKVAGELGVSEGKFKYADLRRKSNELGLDRPKIKDNNYPDGIRLYHKDAWAAVYDIDITKF